MKYKSFFAVTAMCVFSYSVAYGIVRFDPSPDDFVPAGAPEWMNQLDSHANMLTMDSLYQVYLNENPSARTKKNGTKPTVNYYKRWKRAYEPFMQADGSISLPEASAYLHNVDEQNKKSRLKVKNFEKRSNNNERQWRVVGPFVSYHYETKEIFPDQANVYRIDIADTDASVMYCGTETGMIFKSVDKGGKWNACSPEQNFGGNILAVKIDPCDANHVYVGTQSALWETKDGGDSWTRPNGWTTFKGRIDAIDIAPDDSKCIIVGCGYSGRSTSETTSRGSVYRSTDGGTSFTEVISGRGMDVKFNPDRQNEVYVLAKDNDGMVSFFKSTNKGVSFDKITMVRTDIIAARMSVYKTQICVLATTSSSVSPRHLKGKPYLLRSLNCGDTWTESEAYFVGDDKTGGQGYFDMAIAINHNNESEVFYGLISPYCWNFDTQKGFTQSITDFKTHVDIQQALYKNGELWFSTDGGINRTTDFFHEKENIFVHINGIYASEFWGFSQVWNEDIMVGGRFHNGNTAMAPKLYGEKALCLGGGEEPTGHILMSNPRKAIFSDCYAGFILPDEIDGKVGRFTYPVNSNLPNESKHFGTDMKFHPCFAQCFLLSQSSGLYITTNDGNTISSLYYFPDDVIDYDFDRNNPNIIYVLTRGYAMYKSVDGGKVFTQLEIPQEMQSYQSKLAINPYDTNDIWVTPRTTGQVFRSRDGGNNWEKVDEGLDSKYALRYLVATGDKVNSVYALAWEFVTPDFGDESWVESSVLYYDDAQQRWSKLDANLPSWLNIIKIYPYYPEQKIRVASNNGIYELPLLSENQRPIAQPMVLNVPQNDPLSPNETCFDSYSIAPFDGTIWDWTFAHEDGATVMEAHERNPKIIFPKRGYYDVTLKVTTADGQSAEKTVSRMIYSNNESTDIQTTDYGVGEVYPTVINRGDDVTVKMKQSSSNVKITFYSLSGNKLAEHLLHDQIQQINTCNLPQGVVLYKIVDENSKLTAGKLLVK